MNELKPLTAANVLEVLKACMFQEGEDTSDPAIGEVVMTKFGFHKGRLAEHTPQIRSFLAELNHNFRENEGGGWSFLNAPFKSDGTQWGEHRNVDELLALGIACGSAKILSPRDTWEAFPGGLPYFSVSIDG